MSDILLIYAYDKADRGYIISVCDDSPGFYCTIYRENRSDGTPLGSILHRTGGHYAEPIMAINEAIEWVVYSVTMESERNGNGIG